MSVRVMADLYNAPELITGYCMGECPVHGFLPLATEEKSPDGYVCEGCIEDMSAGEFMELIGETFSTAEKEE